MNKNEEGKKPFNYNYISVALLYAVALLFIVSARSISEADSKIFPYIVAGLTIVLASIILIKSLFNLGRQETFDFTGSFKAFKFGVVLLIYIALTVIFGFYISTPIYLFFGMKILGQKNLKLMLIVSVATPLIIYLFFDLLLGMEIPTGIFF